MFYSDNPVADFLRYDAECDREMDRLPRCCECEEPIQDEDLYDFDGDLICHYCLINNHRKPVEDYID